MRSGKKVVKRFLKKTEGFAENARFAPCLPEKGKEMGRGRRGREPEWVKKPV
jgi:hypothetical protein